MGDVCVSQSCLSFGDLMDYSLPGSSVHEILQARMIEWVAIPFSAESEEELKSLLMKVKV